MIYYIISDFICKLKLGYISHFVSIKVLKNKITVKLLFILQKLGVIRGFFFLEKGNEILVYLKYTKSQPLIKNITAISKPSKRIYWTLNFLSKNYNKNEFSTIYIISTPKGLLTQNDIILTSGFSGEVLCKIKL